MLCQIRISIREHGYCTFEVLAVEAQGCAAAVSPCHQAWGWAPVCLISCAVCPHRRTPDPLSQRLHLCAHRRRLHGALRGLAAVQHGRRGSPHRKLLAAQGLGGGGHAGELRWASRRATLQRAAASLDLSIIPPRVPGASTCPCPAAPMAGLLPRCAGQQDW